MNLIESVLAELEEDYVGLWLLFKEARMAESSGANISEIVLTTTRELIRNPNVVVGDFVNQDFLAWTYPQDRIMEEIVARLTKLNRDPDIGEVCWFSMKKG